MGLSNYIPSSRIAQSGVCTSTTRPATPFEGQMIYETDTNRVLVYDNTAWVMIADTDTPPGMQLIATGDFSGNQTNVSNVFSSDFLSYRIEFSDMFASSTSASTALEFYLRTGSTNTTSGFYYANVYGTYSGSPANAFFGGSNSAFWNITYTTTVTTQPAHMVFDIQRPFTAEPTTFSGFATAPDSWRSGGGQHQVSTSYDGFSLKITGAGISLTGKYAVYGYRN